jgi:hypothetical protein
MDADYKAQQGPLFSESQVGVEYKMCFVYVNGQPSSEDPFTHPIEYSPTDKAILNRALRATRSLLVPHTLLLQMLNSRFQAIRYRDSGLMVVILRLIMRSAMAYKDLRCETQLRIRTGRSDDFSAPTPLLAKQGSLWYFSASKASKVVEWTRLLRPGCEMLSTRQLSLGLL